MRAVRCVVHRRGVVTGELMVDSHGGYLWSAVLGMTGLLRYMTKVLLRTRSRIAAMHIVCRASVGTPEVPPDPDTHLTA